MLSKPIQRRSRADQGGSTNQLVREMKQATRDIQRGANDNLPRLPRQGGGGVERRGANDNYQQWHKQEHVRRALRVLRRAHMFGRFVDPGLWQGGQNIDGFFDLTGGWSEVAKCNSPPIGPPVFKGRGNGLASTLLKNVTNACTPNQAWQVGQDDMSDPANQPTPTSRYVTYGYITDYSPQRCTAWVVFERPIADSGSVRWIPPSMRPPVLLSYHSDYERALWHYAPHTMPINQPLANPFPIATGGLKQDYSDPNTQRPRTQKDTEYAFGAVQNNWSLSLEVSLDGTPVQNPRPAPEAHVLRPPRPYERERKQKFTRAQVAMLGFIGAATEGLDHIYLLYDLIPNKFKPRWKDTNLPWRKPPPQIAAQAIFDNFEHLELEKLPLAWLEMQIEDRIYGQIGKLGGDVSKRFGHAYGGGVNTLNRLLSDVIREVGN